MAIEIADVRAALEALRVKSGGLCTHKKLGEWEIGLGEGTRDESDAYVVTLRKGAQKARRLVPHTFFFTKGKGKWRRDNSWRLNPEAVESLTANIHEAITKHDAKASASP